MAQDRVAEIIFLLSYNVNRPPIYLKTPCEGPDPQIGNHCLKAT